MPAVPDARMRRQCLSLILLASVCNTAIPDDEQRQDQLVWDYAEFVQAFSSRNWSQLARFVTPQTKVGFGGEMGMDGVVRVFDANDDCHQSMVHALEMGCRKVGDGDGTRCVSPPQLGPDVVYLGARASFAYNADVDTWMPEFLICGGD